MLTWEAVQNLIKSESSDFALGLSKAASGKPTEPTFRDKLMPVIADFCKKAGKFTLVTNSSTAADREVCYAVSLLLS